MCVELSGPQSQAASLEHAAVQPLPEEAKRVSDLVNAPAYGPRGPTWLRMAVASGLGLDNSWQPCS